MSAPRKDTGARTGRIDPKVAGVLPLSALDERIAIVGTSGSGKTYASKGLVERLLEASARVCVVDPLGVWWGLRAGADGVSPGDPVVVFGGRHADVVRIPTEASRAFRRKPAGDSNASQPSIPRQTSHP